MDQIYSVQDFEIEAEPREVKIVCEKKLRKNDHS